MEYYSVSEEKVNKLLKASPRKLCRTEKWLCSRLEITEQALWKRYKSGKWRREAVDSLRMAIGEALGGGPVAMSEVLGDEDE